MRTSLLPAASEILELLRDEIAALDGAVPDVFAEEDRLYARAVLPDARLVQPGDAVHGGVAVRTRGPQVLVHPYAHRVVCTNGAIAAVVAASRRIARLEITAPPAAVERTTAALRIAIRDCAAPSRLEAAVGRMRSALEVEADLMLHLLPLLRTLPRVFHRQVLHEVLERFEEGGDMSAFGLIGAVTSLARDTRDPEARWHLEELGGAILAMLPAAPRAVVTTAALPRHDPMRFRL